MKLIRRTTPKSIERQVVEDNSQQWQRDMNKRECKGYEVMRQWWSDRHKEVYEGLNPAVKKPVPLGPGNVDKVL